MVVGDNLSYTMYIDLYILYILYVYIYIHLYVCVFVPRTRMTQILEDLTHGMEGQPPKKCQVWF